MAKKKKQQTKTKIVIIMVEMIINKSYSVFCSTSQAREAAMKVQGKLRHLNPGNDGADCDEVRQHPDDILMLMKWKVSRDARRLVVTQLAGL